MRGRVDSGDEKGVIVVSNVRCQPRHWAYIYYILRFTRSTYLSSTQQL